MLTFDFTKESPEPKPDDRLYVLSISTTEAPEEVFMSFEVTRELVLQLVNNLV